MKKAAAFLLLVCVLLPSFVLSVSAENNGLNEASSRADGSKIVYLDDGGYLLISPVREVEAGNRTTITRARDVTHYDSDDEVEWKYTLTGTFTYTYGVSATCTNAYYTQTINDDSWTFSDGDATRTGATAHGVGTYVKKFWFITIQTINVDISLTCDIYGNVT